MSSTFVALNFVRPLRGCVDTQALVLFGGVLWRGNETVPDRSE